MKYNIEVEIRRSVRKAVNLKSKVQEISKKLDSLQEELKNVVISIEKTEQFIQSIGVSQPGLNESQEEKLKREKRNLQLQREKEELLQNLKTENPAQTALQELDRLLESIQTE
jgi:uncharacterized protein (DUF3084 family)